MSITNIDQTILQQQLQKQTEDEKRRIELQNKIAQILSETLQTINEIALEIATIEDEKCKSCQVVSKCKVIIKLLKDLINIQREYLRRQ